ncbi:MAG: WYL domain-containing protein [Candidatus Nanopelagicales bacterium]
MTTTARLLRLLSLLQTRRDWPGSLLASRLKVSDRTVRRDVDRLRELGHNIQATMGPEGGYRLNAGTEMPPLLFDEDQTAAIAIALQSSPSLGAGIDEAATRALGTIRQVMPSPLRRRLDALEVTALRPAEHVRSADVSLDVVVTIANNIRDRQILRFDYGERVGVDVTASGSFGRRRTEPHHLVTSNARWYLLGWDLDRDDWRLYRVDRIVPRVPPGSRFTPRALPGGDVNEFVSARFKGSDTNEWPCQGAVVLHLPARKVVPFAEDGRVTEVDAQTCRLEAGSWSWEALAAWYGRFNVAMDVIGPPELAAAFATLAERFALAATLLPHHDLVGSGERELVLDRNLRDPGDVRASD